MATKAAVASVGTVDIAHFATEERQLSNLATQYRSARTRNDNQCVNRVVQEYQQIAEDMHRRGWDGKWLSADDMLPDWHMPDFLKPA